MFAHKSTVGATIGRPKTNGDCSEKAGDQWSPLQTKLKISRCGGLFAHTICRDRASAVAEQQDGPKTHNNRNENDGRFVNRPYGKNFFAGVGRGLALAGTAYALVVTYYVHT